MLAAAVSTGIPSTESSRPVMTAPAVTYAVTYSSERGMTSAAETPEDIPMEDIPYREPVGIIGRGTANNLEYYYNNSGFPEYISYIYGYDKFMGQDGKMKVEYKVGLTDLSEENKNAVLDIASENCCILFEQGGFSFTYRAEVYLQLRDEFPEYHIRMAEDSSDIYIYAAENKDDCLKKLDGRYEGLVFVTDEEGISYCGSGEAVGKVDIPMAGLGVDGALTGGFEPAATETAPSLPLIAAICAAGIMLLAAVIFFLRRRIRLSADGTAALSRKLSSSDVEELIRRNSERPSPELKQKIFNMFTDTENTL